MPIRPDSIKPPAILVPRTFVPVNGHKHPVAIGESWVSLAATVGRSPWDLIRYNYPTLPADLQLVPRRLIGICRITSAVPCSLPTNGTTDSVLPAKSGFRTRLRRLSRRIKSLGIWCCPLYAGQSSAV